MAATLVFVHGLESTGQGAKGQYFQKNFPEMIVEDYPGDFAKRMERLNDILDSKNNLILVGSSFGGLMVAQYAVDNESRITRLILLAPALNLPEFRPKAQKPFHAPVIIYHGSNDNIVDPHSVKRIAKKAFSQMEYHLVDDDHSLHETFPILNWKKMLHAE